MKNLNLIVLALFSLFLVSCGSSGSSSSTPTTATNNGLLLSLNSDGLSIGESGKANITIESNFSATTTDLENVSFTATFNVSYGTATASDFSVSTTTREITENITIATATGNISFDLPINAAADLKIMDDNALEADETFVLRLTSFEVDSDLFPATTTIDPAKNSITVTIKNDDRVTLSVSAVATSVNEAGGNANFTVSFDGESAIAIPFSYSVTASGDKPADADDFVGGAFPSDTVSIAIDATTTTISIDIEDDDVLELAESFLFSLAASGDATTFPNSFIDFDPPTAAVNIENDDRVTLSITPSTPSIREDAGSVDFTVSVTTGVSAIAIPFSYSVTASGDKPADADDFGGTFPSNTDFIAIDSTTTTINIAIDNDDELELAESFLFSLTASGDAATFPNSFIDFDTTTATIESDETITISDLTASTNSIAEDGGATTITFTADIVAPIDVEITYSLTGTATLTEDYTSTQTNSVTIVTGTSTTSVTITAVDDDKADTNETIVLTVTGANLVNTTTTQTITITIDDDEVDDNNNGLIDLTTAADFTNIRNALTSGYELLNNLDLASFTNFVPIGEFTGVFDGNDFSIKNLTINRGGTSNVGLFSRLNGATVRNLTIKNPRVTGRNNVGALAGQATNSTIDNVGVLANSSSFINGSERVGGLVGGNISSTINNSWAAVSVVGNIVGGLVGRNSSNATISNSWASGSVVGVGSELVGGLVGLNFTNATINNSWASGSVVGNKAVGGLVGRNSSNATISNSWASGSVVGNTEIGGLVGSSTTNATISDSYWNSETSGQTTSSGDSGVTGVTTAEMIEATGAAGAAFDDWNTITDSTWDFGEITEYPTIISNVATADFQLVYQVAGQLRLIPAADTNGTGRDFFGDSNIQDELSVTATNFAANSTLAIFDLNAQAGNTNDRDDFSVCAIATVSAFGNTLLTTNGVNGTTVTVTIAADTTNPANWTATAACEIVIGAAQPTKDDKLNLTVEITKGNETATRQFKITFE